MDLCHTQLRQRGVRVESSRGFPSFLCALSVPRDREGGEDRTESLLGGKLSLQSLHSAGSILGPSDFRPERFCGCCHPRIWELKLEPWLESHSSYRFLEEVIQFAPN